MTEVSLTGEQLMRVVFIEAPETETGHLRVQCNISVCREVFFEGRDYKLPDDWMTAAAKHAVEKHPEELED